ncbi:MAG: lamin tail domain-containing protein [Planctomycetales bacterium]|nr:lamin tail domain-containing protein [Planctomycetales bacterium]
MKLRSPNSIYIPLLSALTIVSVMATSGSAQLRITEIMADSVDDTNWEWIEVKNESNAAVDLNGYVYHDMNRALQAANISSATSANTMIPAGGVAVLFNGSNLSYDESRFRNAWGLAPTVPLIGVTSPPRLNNGGDQIGIWPNFDAYTADLGAVDGNMEVVKFDNAAVWIDFDGDFPSPSAESIYWKGSGDIRAAANWAASANGEAGAYGSTPTFFESAQINNTEDLGNPGIVPAGNAAAGLLITEIMYNPKSDDDNFEWVEIYNNTGAKIDFGTTPYFFDDTSGSAFEAPNLSAGSIENGETAVIYNSKGVTEASMKAAWGDDVNFIGTANFSGLNNGGDGIGFWTDAAKYASDRNDDTFLGAVTFVNYEDNSNNWPADSTFASIYLSDLSADQHDGSNWKLSISDDGISSNADAAFESMIPDHPGGDIASPGFVPSGIVNPNLGDFDNDGDLDVDDIDALSAEVRAGTNTESFDLNNDAVVSGLDRVVWVEELKNTFFGDSNLDGEFNSTDFVSVFTSGLYESETKGTATWGTGDWNGDGNFDSSDFVTAFQSQAYEKGPRQANAVPEPSAVVSLLVGIGALIGARRR